MSSGKNSFIPPYMLKSVEKYYEGQLAQAIKDGKTEEEIGEIRRKYEAQKSTNSGLENKSSGKISFMPPYMLKSVENYYEGQLAQAIKDGKSETEIAEIRRKYEAQKSTNASLENNASTTAVNSSTNVPTTGDASKDPNKNG
jgi:hypothetical protein